MQMILRRNMNLDLTSQQGAFRNEVRAFIKERLPTEIRDRLRAGHPPRKEDTVIFKAITPPSFRQFSGLLKEAQAKAKKINLKKSDVKNAIIKARKSKWLR